MLLIKKDFWQCASLMHNECFVKNAGIKNAITCSVFYKKDYILYSCIQYMFRFNYEMTRLQYILRLIYTN